MQLIQNLISYKTVAICSKSPSKSDNQDASVRRHIKLVIGGNEIAVKADKDNQHEEFVDFDDITTDQDFDSYGDDYINSDDKDDHDVRGEKSTSFATVPKKSPKNV